MITIHDKNESWVPPHDFEFISVHPRGGYLIVTYERHLNDHTTQTVTIYLQEMGREVLRTVEVREIPVVAFVPAPLPVGRWFQFRNSFYVALEAIQEMFLCLRSN